jgi:hypothetical protein
MRFVTFRTCGDQDSCFLLLMEWPVVFQVADSDLSLPTGKGEGGIRSTVEGNVFDVDPHIPFQKHGEHISIGAYPRTSRNERLRSGCLFQIIKVLSENRKGPPGSCAFLPDVKDGNEFERLNPP